MKHMLHVITLQLSWDVVIVVCYYCFLSVLGAGIMASEEVVPVFLPHVERASSYLISQLYYDMFMVSVPEDEVRNVIHKMCGKHADWVKPSDVLSILQEIHDRRGMYVVKQVKGTQIRINQFTLAA